MVDCAHELGEGVWDRCSSCVVPWLGDCTRGGLAPRSKEDTREVHLVEGISLGPLLHPLDKISMVYLVLLATRYTSHHHVLVAWSILDHHCSGVFGYA